MTPFRSEHVVNLAEILKSAAEAEILPRFRNLTDGAIRQKTSAHDLVTDADVAAEVRIEAGIRHLFPSAVVVGEEATSQDPSLLGKFHEAELAFLVDPVDGTKNFASGLTLFGSMIAVTVRGETVAGVIHDPICGDTVIAVKGEGAWRRSKEGAESRLRVAAPQSVGGMEGCVSWHHLPAPLRERVPARFPKIGIVSSYRCAAHEYRLAASGACDFLLYAKLMPWDHAAGCLLHQEAGGYSARFDGTAYRPTEFSGGLLCAADRECWQALRATLLD
ncbi:inositol monophosphatase family protein [Microvirga alba]|uniref:Inositol monophosphatase n=1 Tax=Microvirga alba TaxID=2791025 RepID=A0A931BV17_9HYPH|nr:inositol monophosphatase family protein [Microvirga alba]MBF9235248.1 inositol monophosphatase [Microvirga alba]